MAAISSFQPGSVCSLLSKAGIVFSACAAAAVIIALVVFQGRGILLSDDDTCYEGEFTADMQLSGKVILAASCAPHLVPRKHAALAELIARHASSVFHCFRQLAHFLFRVC